MGRSCSSTRSAERKVPLSNSASGWDQVRPVHSSQSTQCQDLRCMRRHSWGPTAVKDLRTKLICVFREDSSHRGPAFTDLSRSITRPWNTKTDALLLQLFHVTKNIPVSAHTHSF